MMAPTEVERLAQAKNLDDFRAALPYVPLQELHEPTQNKLSQFPLIWAISARDHPLKRVQLMLAAGARLDLTTRGGETILHEMAAMKNKAKIRLAILRLLVFKGAAVEAVNARDETPLSVAIDRGSTDDVRHFIAVGAKVRKCHLKAAAYRPDKLRVLIDHIADDPDLLAQAASLGGWLRGEVADWRRRAQERTDTGGKSSFFAGIIERLTKSLKMIAELPSYLPADAEKRFTWVEEPAAFTAIQVATTLDAYRSALACVEISSYGIGTNGEITLGGDHPIYWPVRAKEERLDRLWLMLSAGASVKGRPGNGEALHIFAEERRRDLNEQEAMARMLVLAGAQIDARDYGGMTPLAIAVAGRGYAETTALLGLGANPKVQLEWKTLESCRFIAPLIFAAADEPRIFRLLLECGADTDGRDSTGRSLPEYLDEAREEYRRLAARDDMSGNLMRHVNRNLRALTQSLGILAVA
ncbi:MAG: ankyrin repeat domain-containing protein [Pseudomonadota bacterium]